MKKINVFVTRKNLIDEDIPKYGFKFKGTSINIISLPVVSAHPIESEEVKATMVKLEQSFYNYCIFLSSQAVNIFFNKINTNTNRNLIIKKVKEMEIIAIGPNTSEILGQHGFESTIATSQNNYSIDSIISHLKILDRRTEKDNSKENIKVLIPRSSESIKSNNFIETKFNNIVVDQVFFYEIKVYNDVNNSIAWNDLRRSIQEKDTNFFIFTSPSNVRSFFEILKTLFADKKQNYTNKDLANFLDIDKVISIGPKTSRELQRNNIEYLESDMHTIDGAIKFLIINIEKYI